MIHNPGNPWLLLLAIPLMLPTIIVLYHARRRVPEPDYLAIARMEREIFGTDDQP